MCCLRRPIWAAIWGFAGSRGAAQDLADDDDSRGDVAARSGFDFGSGGRGSAGDRDGAPFGSGGERLRRSAGGQGAGREFGARFVELPLEAEGAPGQRGLCEGAGRGVLRQAAGASGGRVGGDGLGGHDSRGARDEGSDSGYSGDAGADASGERASGSGGGTGRELRGDAGRLEIEHGGVKVMGPLNLPSRLATHASQLFSKNVQTFVLNMVKDGSLVLDLEDPIVSGSLLARDGKVVHPMVLERMGGKS